MSVKGTPVLDRPQEKTTIENDYNQQVRENCRRVLQGDYIPQEQEVGFSQRVRYSSYTGKSVAPERPQASNPSAYPLGEDYVADRISNTPEIFRADGKYATQYADPSYKNMQEFDMPRASMTAAPATNAYFVPTEEPQYDGNEIVGNGYRQPAPDWDYVTEANEPIYQSMTAESEDVRPTATTIQYATVHQSAHADAAVEEESEFRLTSAAKMVIAVFVTVLIMLMSVIVINAMALNSANAEVEALLPQLQELTNQAAALESEIEIATSEEAILEFAQNAGMVLAK